MNHPLNVQIDDFGVWAVELDFSVVLEGFVRKAVVGHDRPGHATCWGHYLTDFLSMIRNTISIRYRPVFIYFEIKDWDDSEAGFTREQKFSDAVAAVDHVFEGNYIILAEYVKQHGYPAMEEIAGKAVIFFPSPEYPNDRFPDPPFGGTLHSKERDTCTSREDIESLINGSDRIRVLRLDQYQADWTFEYGVAPNPIVVDHTASSPWTVLDSVGDEWSCNNGDVSKGQIVHEQGTFRFQYKTLTKAATRAKGNPFTGGNPTGETPDRRRTGYGWTVLIRPGTYAETVTIDIPLTLKKDDRFAGTAVIGR